jgi:hypothetical protein
VFQSDAGFQLIKRTCEQDDRGNRRNQAREMSVTGRVTSVFCANFAPKLT